MLEIIASEDTEDIFSELPNMVSTPELNVPASDEGKFFLVEEFIKKTDFSNAKIIDIDGIRVEYEKGWGLLRASNTSPVLVLRFEAETEDDLNDIKTIFYENLKRIEPDIENF